MMAILGNILLVIAALLFIGVLSVIKSPMPGGDAGVGYAWALLLSTGGFFIAMILAGLCVGAVDGYDWVGAPGTKRFLWVAGGLVSALVTFALTSFFKNEQGPVPGIIRALSTFTPYIIPIVLIGAGFILVNTGIRQSVPSGLYKWPLVAVTILGFIGTGTAVISWMGFSMKRQAEMMKAATAFSAGNDQRILGEIDSCDVMKSIYPILIFSGDNQPESIRTRAVAKIKTNPNWQDELLRMLRENGTTEVFQFLASNDVDDPSLFVEPIREGIFLQAEAARQRIREVWHSSNFYVGMFGWETEWILRTVEKYERHGGDYLEAVKAFRAALDEPSDFEKTAFTAANVLDKWIKKSEKLKAKSEK